MSALVIPSLAELAEARDFDEVCAELAEAVAIEPDPGVLHRFAKEVEAASAVDRLYREAGHLDSAQLSLAKLALWAHAQAGRRLKELNAGSRGRGRKGERRKAAEAAGIDRETERDLVELGKMETDRLERIVSKLETDERRITVHTVLSVADQRANAPGSSDEWYTGVQVVQPLHELFGGDFTDLASCAVAQRVVQAARFYTGTELQLGEVERAAGITEAEFEAMRSQHAGVGVVYDHEGRVIRPDTNIKDPAKRAKKYAAAANRGRISHALKLRGKVFGNPPYAFPVPFLRAVIDGFIRGDITEALLLLNVATATVIQQELLGMGSTCFVGRRLAFRDRYGREQGSNRNEQVLFYLGARLAEYVQLFAHLGQIVKCMK